jgi:UDP-N-acetylglucosamine acyltransferase
LSIHPSAIVSAEAEIAADAEIGPYCVVTGRVKIGSGSVVESHVRIGSRFGRVSIGERNHIQSGAVLGGPPQDFSYEDADTALVIGHDNRIGEYVSINLGTPKGGGTTRLGDHNFIMAFAHLGHDCRLGDYVVVTNATQLAGHVIVEDHALLSGLAGVTQFVRLGTYSFLAAGSFANKDILPYTIAEGHWAAPRATNRVGLRRAGFSAEARRNIDRAVRIFLDRKLTIDDVTAKIREECTPDPQIEHLLAFLDTSDRGVART